jgi:hypothetical protein
MPRAQTGRMRQPDLDGPCRLRLRPALMPAPLFVFRASRPAVKASQAGAKRGLAEPSESAARAGPSGAP